MQTETLLDITHGLKFGRSLQLGLSHTGVNHLANITTAHEAGVIPAIQTGSRAWRCKWFAPEHTESSSWACFRLRCLDAHSSPLSPWQFCQLSCLPFCPHGLSWVCNVSSSPRQSRAPDVRGGARALGGREGWAEASTGQSLGPTWEERKPS